MLVLSFSEDDIQGYEDDILKLTETYHNLYWYEVMHRTLEGETTSAMEANLQSHVTDFAFRHGRSAQNLIIVHVSGHGGTSQDYLRLSPKRYGCALPGKMLILIVL